MKLKMLVTLAFTVLACMSFIAVPVMSFPPQPDPPGDIIRALERLDELKDLIDTNVDLYQTLFTDTNTMQQANALYHKIDVVIGMVQQDSKSLEAIKKLEKDISPKLGWPPDPVTPSPSWLTRDPELQLIVEDFADECQNLIGQIIMYLTQPLD